jgi:hypothetical protein
MSNNKGFGYSGVGYSGIGDGGGCNYARLGAYTGGFRGIRPPVPTTTVAGYYVVPSYSAPGYDTLQHGSSQLSSGPYFSIGRAYGYGADACSTNYMGSICM